MAFKYRLQIFFVILTILPLLAAGWAISGISGKNRTNRSDQQLAITLGSAEVLFARDEAAALATATQVAARPDVQTRLQKPTNPSATQQLANILTQVSAGRSFQLAALDKSGHQIANTLPGDILFSQKATVAKSGSIVAAEAVQTFVHTLRTQAGIPADDQIVLMLRNRAYTTNGKSASASLAAIPFNQPKTITLLGTRERVFARPIELGRDQEGALVATTPQSKIDDAIRSIQIRTIAILLVAMIAIAILAGLLVRSLTSTLRTFAERARSIAAGHFDQQVPTPGKDEFAQFGRAFNDMSAQLERRIDELEDERRRVQDAVGRFGVALASTHDVTALLDVVLRSAMQVARARGGRLLVTDEVSGVLVEQLRAGETETAAPLLDVEARAPDGTEGRALQDLTPVIGSEPVDALAAPLVTEASVLGLLTLVGPEDGAFDDQAARAVGALAGQGAVAIENARLHRLIQKQARTDGLTGLANHREFQEQLAHEVERAQRFGVPVGLVLLDLDDFKTINDQYGHLAGDNVLKAVSGALRGAIRDIDQASRYGGEEFAVILPHTTIEGATRLAERLRQAIAERVANAPDGRQIRITASFGVAGLPAHSATQVELIATADAALYRAKQTGKNRVAVGPPHGGSA
jgi:diguanylate cyclase (GGDEF)-like protein